MILVNMGNMQFYTEDKTFIEFNEQLQEIITTAKMIGVEVKFFHSELQKEVSYLFSHDELSFFSLLSRYDQFGYISCIRVMFHHREDTIINGFNIDLLAYADIYEGERNFKVLDVLKVLREKIITHGDEKNECNS